MQNRIQSQSLVFLKVYSDKGKVYFRLFFLFMRITGSLIISSINRSNGRMYFTLHRVKEEQSESLLLGGSCCSEQRM